MRLTQRLGAEGVASFFLAWLAILVWQGIFPALGDLERLIRQPGAWGELFGVLVISGSYYGLLSLVLYGARRYNPKVHPIAVAYFGGWWLVVLLAALSVYSPTFDSILGLSMATSGTNLVFITLFVGAAKFWVEGYLRQPPRPPQQEKDAAGDQSVEASHDRPA